MSFPLIHASHVQQGVITTGAQNVVLRISTMRQVREQRLFEVKPFSPCFDFVSHRNGVSTNLHQVRVKNGFKGADIFWILQTAYGGAIKSRRRVFEWYKLFKEGREETADKERSGRPSTSTTPEKVDITVREVAEEAGISFGSTQSIMKNILGVRRLNAVLVPKDLTFDQKNARKETASLNLEATTDDPELLKRVITGDETWIYGFDSETTQQASEWRFKNEPTPKKARRAPSKVKVMLTVFFDYQGIVHNEFQQQGSTFPRMLISLLVLLFFHLSISNAGWEYLNDEKLINIAANELKEEGERLEAIYFIQKLDSIIFTNQRQSLHLSPPILERHLVFILNKITYRNVRSDSFREKPPKKTTAIFLDMTSAFDRVWREKLREKLNNIGSYQKTKHSEKAMWNKLGSKTQNSQNNIYHLNKTDNGICNTGLGSLKLITKMCLGKVLDSLLAQRLKHWLESNELLSSFQHGFREGKPTTTALNEVLEGVEMGLNKGAWVLFVALDIDGAFNSMSWNKLMRNLMDMGCPDNLCSLIRDFLRDRRISLSFGGRKLEINCARGCPQGSCCGPILWNILVNTVFQEELHEGDRLVLYADDQTISRRLVANGLHSCRPLRRLPLTPPNRRQRLEWCRARSTWMTEWHRVVFSDESRFCLSSDSRRVRVWRRRGERSNPAAIGTMTAQRYVDDVLRPVTLPYLQGVPNALYQQDNARPHTARISQQALQDVQMLPWPPYSPDLSPIEHVWDIIGRRLHALPQPRSEDELWQMTCCCVHRRPR
ncbi:hypothetical protein LAZ67_7002950 [Cordylochernes scorpioides]|uniref:Reverse transcriptase domain-containing protein n=1 Tax=Cordylochernes scorpioides TaxID=51811 RepID=A0ABY6KRS3_9ARAC|nr:hypothetical protein LAZ67_7002950 [Cordylochernes scorpioides]